jgi:hypothetical protein
MATIHYSTLINGSTVSFNPLTDVLLFDVNTISAADLGFTPYGSDDVTLNVAGRSVTSTGVTLGDFTSTNLVLTNGSQLVQASVGNAYTPSLSGQAGNDLLVGSASDKVPSLMSTSSTGVQGNNISDQADISADGRFVAFISRAEGADTVAPVAPAAAAAAARTPWPSDLKAQLRSVADLLAASPVALSEAQVAERYGGRGQWKKRLPDLLATLEALARARCDDGLWRGA